MQKENNEEFTENCWQNFYVFASLKKKTTNVDQQVDVDHHFKLTLKVIQAMK